MKVAQIAVIGSSKLDESNKDFKLIMDLGKRLVDENYRILCGGLGGVMEAVCRGAKLSSRYREGMTVGILPSHDLNTANPYIDIKIATGMSISRNQIIISSADAVVSASGGSGTLSEISFAWQLGKPIISLVETGGWSEKIAGKKIDDSRKDKVHSAKNIEQVISFISEILKK